MNETKVIEKAEDSADWDDESFSHCFRVRRIDGKDIPTHGTALCGQPWDGGPFSDIPKKPVCPICKALIKAGY